MQDDYKADNIDDNEEPLIIRMLETMLAKRKTVEEGIQITQGLEVDKLIKELRWAKLKERARLQNEKIYADDAKRLQECAKLF
eukprot:CAMPEP_0176338504 /NCGR_PEP_ID=MMETSP0126-20121128/16_1 /TAXON_ID=141414 ORGANISM="Strombidinopsis acuminatum, Strain SPMC142" /NCGR_SAMPLE_ID=MMETSP0126 /ASSEMBLY_ACC=CAM_ASM_000229 /LENGTH=82 /DNA_ID=CAMNT_0017681531 /DNA_START=43 /DNA_END=291 /DNA_ORIENTATION=+